jgi:nucleotide-binding universal stress UspA family protein
MYRTILVHIDSTKHSEYRSTIAATLAREFCGRLIGSVLTGAPPLRFPVGPAYRAAQPESDPAATERALDRFEAIARGVGAGAIERRSLAEDADIGLCMQARYCDLVVIGQSCLRAAPPAQEPDLPHVVVLHSPRPVLVLPAKPAASLPGKQITVAWNGSNEAARAISSALPLLQRARMVHLVVFDADLEPDTHGQDPGADMAAYLAHHGVPVQVSNARGGRDEAGALLSFAADHASDLIVMGAYGRSRFRQLMLGGMTCSMLETSPLPLWMAH